MSMLVTTLGRRALPVDRRFNPYEVFDFVGVGSIVGLLRGIRLTATGGANGTIVDPYGNVIAAANPRITHDPSGVTNSCLQSENMGVAPWTGAGAAVADEYYGGARFWTFSKLLGSANETRLQTLRAPAVGESITLTAALLAGSTNAVSVGLYGTTTNWGATGDSTASVLSGPGVLTRQAGSLWSVTGLSATVPTLVTMRRVYASTESMASLYVYPGLSSSTTIGHSIKIARPMLEWNVATPSAVYVPTGATPASALRSRLGLLAEWASTNKVTQSQADTGFVAAGTTPPTVTPSVSHLGLSSTKIEFPAASDLGYAGCRASRTGNPYSVASGSATSCSIYVALSRPLTGGEQISYYPTGASGGLEYVINALNSGDYVGRFKRVELPNMVASVTGSNYANLHVKTALTAPLSVYVNREQDEGGALCTSYIPTTGSAVLRSAGSYRTMSPGEVGLSSTVGAVYAEFIMPGTSMTAIAVGLNASASDSLFVSSSGIVAGWNGAGQLGVIGSPPAGAVCKAVYTWSGPNQKVCCNGGAVASNASGAPTVTAFEIGSGGGGNSPLSAPVRRVMTFNRFLTDAEMQALTS